MQEQLKTLVFRGVLIQLEYSGYVSQNLIGVAFLSQCCSKSTTLSADNLVDIKGLQARPKGVPMYP